MQQVINIKAGPNISAVELVEDSDQKYFLRISTKYIPTKFFDDPEYLVYEYIKSLAIVTTSGNILIYSASDEILKQEILQAIEKRINDEINH